MRVMSAMLVLVALSAGVVACGGSGSSHGSTSAGASQAAVARSTAKARPAAATPNANPMAGGAPFRPMSEGLHRGYLNDSDSDVGVPGATNRYRDVDEANILPTRGVPAKAEVRHAVTALLQRYYALARAGNGKAACAMLAPKVAQAIVLDHGRGGPPYEHSAKTCTEVMTRLFEHRRSELSAPVEVTGVLVKGEFAYALLGSRKIPAGFQAVTPTAHGWRVVGILDGPID